MKHETRPPALSALDSSRSGRSQNGTNSMSLRKLTQKDFKDVLRSQKPFCILAKAKWHGNATMMQTIYSKVAADYRGTVQFGFIDVEEYGDNLNAHFSVRQVPTTFVFKGGTILRHVEGTINGRKLREMLDHILQEGR